jgi:hypothetical protein
MGDAASARLLDHGTGFGVNWGKSFNPDHSNTLNYIAMIRHNLSTLIETAAWDGGHKVDDQKPFN